ncbi:MAG: 4-alpha-glucanotransferase, partial [Candidatus Aminicenantaceae bacterium]
MSCAEERENKRQRGSGVLLHITSLPSPYGIGDLGPGAYAFADFLAASKQRYWQVLPLNPTDLACANSPYHSFSAFAFNPLLISPDFLLEDGLLDPRDVGSLPIFSEESIDFRTVIPFKTRILFSAYERFKQRENKQCYEKFCEENVYWLDDYSLFVALKSRFRKRPWHKWPTEIKDRQPKAIDNMRADLTHEIRREKFLQYVFYKQWTSLKNYCNQKGIQVIG